MSFNPFRWWQWAIIIIGVLVFIYLATEPIFKSIF